MNEKKPIPRTGITGERKDHRETIQNPGIMHSPIP